MTEQEIVAKLDLLDEFQRKRDLVEFEKRKLLDDTKVPEDVQSLVASGLKAMAEADEMFAPELETCERDCAEDVRLIEQALGIELAAIVVPPEVQAILAEIDAKRKAAQTDAEAKRAEARAERERVRNAIQIRISAMKDNIKESTREQTQAVFDAIEARKHDIEIEFAGKTSAADANIEALKKEIEDAVKQIKFTVRGQFYRAEYGKPRKSWIADRLEAYTESHPDIKGCYTEGSGSCSIKRIK